MGAICLPIFISYVGLAFFLYGFFLTRRELNLKSSVETAAYTNNKYSYAPNKTAINLADVNNAPTDRRNIQELPRKKVFLFIVDALRLDFMTKKMGTIGPDSPYNRFQHMHRLLEHNASQSLLFGFRADPPTVTAQRLKSMTTGALPTFIDIGANMNSSAITEDNFIDQLLSRAVRNITKDYNNNETTDNSTSSNSCTSASTNQTNSTTVNSKPILIALGDDTWGSLFPTQFTTTHYYDSFNTRDLDTVDNGIISHLFDYLPCGKNLSSPLKNLGGKYLTLGTECKEQNKPNWDLMIAHFLGVDHIGHTYDAFHPLMGERLALMDTLLLKVIERLPPSSVLFLFGDHGMTDQGEHGGSSTHETESGLFVYSTEPMFSVQTTTSSSGGTGVDNRSNSGESCAAGDSDCNRDGDSCEPSTATTTYNNSNNIDNSCLHTTTTLYWNDTTQAFEHTPLYNILTNPRVVPQIDFTPTIATLLGVPIPASSLGKVIPELFMNKLTTYTSRNSGNREDVNASGACAEDLLLSTYYTNAMQMWRYLTTYWSTTVDPTHSPSEKTTASVHTIQLSELVFLEKLLLRAVKAHLQLLQVCTTSNNVGICKDTNMVEEGSAAEAEVYAKYVHFFTAVQDFTRNKWTQFKMLPMLVGLLLLVSALFLFLHQTYTTLYSTYTISIGASSTTHSINLNTTTPITHYSLRVLYTLATHTIYSILAVRPAILVVMPVGVVFHSLAALSDNFTKQENWTVFALVHACTLSLILIIWNANKDSRQCEQSKKKTLLGLLLMSMIVVTLFMLGPHSTYITNSTHNTNFASIGLCGTIVIYYYVYHFCLIGLEAGRSRKFSWSDVVMRCNVTVSCICMLAYWAVKYQVWTNSFLYGTVLQCCTYEPICTCLHTLDLMVLLPRTVLVLCAGNICHVLCLACIDKCTTSNHDRVLLWYKLVYMIASFALILGLMLGPMGCVCMVLCLVHSVVFVYCFVVQVNTTGTGISIDTKDDPECATATGTTSSPATVTRVCTYIVYAVYFPVMGRFLYFVTGHRMDFGTLQLWSGFIGSHTFNFNYAGMCLAINTFGPFVLYVLCLYAAALYLFQVITTSSGSKGTAITNKHSISTVVHSVLYVAITYQFAIVCVSCIGVAILRRHLMVWAVFAPKMAFEACIWLSVSLVALLMEFLLPLI